MTDVPVGPAGGRVPADAAGAVLPEGMTEAEAEDLRAELLKVEEEIGTLRQVLAAKERHAVELKRKLGQTPLNQLKINLSKSLHDVQMSNAYKKTQETLSTAGQKTSAAISNVSTVLSRKLGDMRNSTTFKSFEERVVGLRPRVPSEENGSQSLHTPDKSGDSTPF